MPRQPQKKAKPGPLVATPRWMALRNRLWHLALALQVNDKPDQKLRDEICELLHWLYNKPKALQALFNSKKGAKGHGAPAAMAVCYLLHLEAEDAEGTAKNERKKNSVARVALGWGKSHEYVRNQVSKHRELAARVVECADFLPKLRKEHGSAGPAYAEAVRKLAVEIEGTTPTLASRTEA